MRVGSRTDRGMVRPTNEDSLSVDEKLGLFILADGMGGHNAGEIASHMAVERIASAIRGLLAAGKSPERAVQDSVAAANRAILFSSEADPWWRDMGTTVVLALFNGSRVLVTNVGDSRAYMITNGTIRQLTEDHSFVADWIREGTITPDEARTHNARHGLTMALGIEDQVEPCLTTWPWDKTGRLLLCSDGLTDVLEDWEIKKIVEASPDPEHACEELVSAVNAKGGPDNVTVVLIYAE